MPIPQGILGTRSSTGIPQILFPKDTNPYITGYNFYRSSDGTNYSLLGSAPLFSLPAGGYAVLNDNAAGTNFNYYYYLTETGSLPESPPSRVVHAVSGTTTTFDLVVSVSNSASPILSFTGSVTGGVRRVWSVSTISGLPFEWMWGEEAAALTSVAYGFNTYGITYSPALSLASGTSYTCYVWTYNNENWNTDISAVNFTTP